MTIKWPRTLHDEESFPLVLRDLPDVGRVIVVANGSTDKTVMVATDMGAVVVREPICVYGASCLKGLQEIHQSVLTGMPTSLIVEFVVAEYSDHSNPLPDLVEPIYSGRNAATKRLCK